jgi:uncharacterized protein (DUF2141 family)
MGHHTHSRKMPANSRITVCGLKLAYRKTPACNFAIREFSTLVTFQKRYPQVMALAAVLAAAFLPFGGQAKAEAQSCGIKVAVANVGVKAGVIYGSLHSTEDWGQKPTATARTVVADEKPFLCFNAPPGRYAIRLFHDRDGNGQLGTNMMGIPNEPFGFSNDAPVQFGPPSFDAAAFEVGSQGITITVTLH